MRTSCLKPLIGCALAALLLGATKTWSGLTDNKWSTATNWTLPGTPANGDALVFPTIAVLYTSNNDMVNFSPASISISGSSALSENYTISGNTINLNGAPTVTINGPNGIHVLNVPMVLGNNLSISQASTDAATMGGAISGTSTQGIAYSGPQTLLLSGLNSFTGPTVVSAGTLKLGVATALGSTSLVNLSVSGAILDLNGFTVTIGNLAGASGSTVTNSAVGTSTLTVGNGTDQTFSGVIQNGSGTVALVKQGSGTLSLGSVNTFTGGTTITAGTVRQAVASALPAAGPLALTGSSAIFDLNGFNTTINALSGTAGTITNNGASNVTLVAGDTSSPTLASVIQDGSKTVALTKQGSGTLTLSGANTYSGGTTVNAGVLQGTTTSLQGNIVNGAAVHFNQTTDGTYAGALSSSGSVTKLGSGNVTFSGTNTYAGGTTVSAGSLIGTTTSVQGSVVNNASVVFSQSGNGTYGGAMSGTGSVTKSGAGIVTLTGSNSYGGGTVVSGGTLRAGGASAIPTSGLVNLTASGVTLDLNGFSVALGQLSGVANSTVTSTSTGSITLTVGDATTQTFSGTIQDGSGQVALTKQGSGTLTLSGVNTYTGATTVAAGTLKQGASAVIATSSSLNLSASGAIFDLNGFTVSLGALSGAAGTTVTSGAAGAVTVQVGNGSSTTFQGVIQDGSGTVGLSVQGGTALTVTGANTYSGGTVIASGSTLQGDATSLQGTIQNSGTLIFNETADGTYGGTLSGSGTLLKQGSGMLTLTGAGQQNETEILGGVFSVNGSLLSPVTVSPGGALRGVGVISGVVANIAQVDPGNSIGTLQISGSYIQGASGVLNIELNAEGSTDVLQVFGAPGTAVLGGSLNVLPDPGSYVKGATFDFIQTTGGISGTFSAVDFGGFDFMLTFPGGTTARLILDADTLFFSQTALTSNARHVQKYIVDNFAASADLQTVVLATNGLTNPRFTAALNQLHPALFGAFALINLDQSAFITSMAICRPPACFPDSESHLWILPYGVFSHVHRIEQLPQFTSKGGGAAIGYDRLIGRHMGIGSFAGYTHTKVAWTSLTGHATMNDYYGSVYGRWTHTHYSAYGAVRYGWDHFNTRRHIHFTTIDRNSESERSGYHIDAHIGADVRVNMSDFVLVPIGRLDYAFLHEFASKEHGAGSINLSVHSRNSHLLRSEVGMNVNYKVRFASACGAVFVGCSWVRKMVVGGADYTAHFTHLPGHFTVSTFHKPLNMASPTVGCQFDCAQWLSVSASYKGEFSDKYSLNEVDGRVEWRF